MEQVTLKRVDEVVPSIELLAHYKSRLDEFESERETMLAAVDRCAVQQDELHRLEWENRKRADEVRELQEALSDAQSFLFEERQRLLALQAENDELKLQELEDRKRIQHLLSMTTPLEQEVGYVQQGLPSAVTHYPSSSAPSGQPQQQGQQPQQHGGRQAASGERVLRTVFLPTANADALLLKIESLQAQLQEQKQLGEERVASLLADRKLREQEEARHRAAFNAQIEALSGKVRRLEDTLRITTRDYILARREKQEAEARALAATAQLGQDVAAAAADAAGVKRAARAEAERAKESADSRMREYVERFREQVRAREEELSSLSSLHNSTKAAYEHRVVELEGRVARLSEANRSLEQRRQLDCDGWQADITLLRKSLAAVDRKLLQMRLIDRLDDDERLDALLDQLEKRIPSVLTIEQQQQQQQQQQRRRQQAGGRGRGRPAARPPGVREDDTLSEQSEQSIKSVLAGELRAVKQRLAKLDQQAAAKRKALKAGATLLREAAQ